MMHISYSKDAKVIVSKNTLFPKETATVNVKLPGKVTNKDTVSITYRSSDKAVAVVSSNGNITAVSFGTAITVYIIAKAGKHSIKFKLKIN